MATRKTLTMAEVKNICKTSHVTIAKSDDVHFYYYINNVGRAVYVVRTTNHIWYEGTGRISAMMEYNSNVGA